MFVDCLLSSTELVIVLGFYYVKHFELACCLNVPNNEH